MQTFKSYLAEDANYKVEIEGLPTMFIGASSPADLKMKLRKMLKKADMITSVTRVVDGEVRKHFRLKAQGKDEVDESTQVYEISQNTLRNYHAAAGADLQKKREKLNKGTLTKKDLKGGQNRVKGLNRSANKMSEDTQIDEISMGKMAAYAPKAVKSRNDAKSATHSADSNRVTNAKKVIAKRKAGADNYNKKMWGYANVAPTKESVDEAKVGPSHDEIMKAIGNTQSSAQGMAILQKKFKLTAAQARKHMDMFLKDDVQIDEKAGSFHNPKKDKIVDSKKFDLYKKHMKTHNLDEPTVRMAHDNPDHGESKRMMKNPKYSKGLELYKASMKEATYSDKDIRKK